MKKAVIALIVAVLMLTAALTPISAARVPENTLQPLWNYTDIVDVDLYFEDNVGTAYSYVEAASNAYSIKTDIYAYEYVDSDWEYAGESHETIYDFISGTTCSFDATVGSHYKIDYTFTVTVGTKTEVITRTIYGTYN